MLMGQTNTRHDIAKGYSQKMDVDYEETFSPTANLTSVRVLMQEAAQENLILHQMYLKLPTFMHQSTVRFTWNSQRVTR